MEKCKKCGSENVIKVEYPHDNPNHYDGIIDSNILYNLHVKNMS